MRWSLPGEFQLERTLVRPAKWRREHMSLMSLRVGGEPGQSRWHCVVRGTLQLELSDRMIDRAPGDMLPVPRVIEHCMLADDEAAIAMCERVGTLDRGDAGE